MSRHKQRTLAERTAYVRCWKRRNIVKVLIVSARGRAKRQGLAFTITEKDVVIPTHCPLLGIPLLKGVGIIDASPSLDRKDNSKGYTPDNVWIISFQANRMKNTATRTELLTFANSVLREFGEETHEGTR